MTLDPGQHIELFNEAVVSGNWTSFVSRFADDAIVEFVGPPVGPFVGRTAIAQAYESSPPDDTIVARGPHHQVGDELVVPYRWVTTGATGTMRLTEHHGRISRLVIAFD